MKTIYLESTIVLLARLNPNYVKSLFEIGTLKEHNNIKYLVIEEKIKEIE